MRQFFRGTLRKLALLMGLLVLVMLIIPLIRFTFSSDEERIKEVVTRLGVALANHDLDEFKKLTWLSYWDRWGNRSRRDLERQLEAFFKACPVIEVSFSISRVRFDAKETEKTRAWVYLTAAIRAGRKKGGEADLDVARRLGSPELAVLVRKDTAGRWLVATAGRQSDLGGKKGGGAK